MTAQGCKFRRVLTACCCSALVAIAAAGPATAGTIMKLDLGSDSAPDVAFNGTTFSTVSDGNALSTGDQNTDIDYGDFLSATPDIALSLGSLSLGGLNVAGAPTVLGGLVIQPFSGGTLSIYSPANGLLLSGTLANSVLTGPLGSPATGALFTTSFATVTGGSLAPGLIPGSLSLSFSLSDINGGAGLSVTGGGQPSLNSFSAAAALNVAAEQVPEPGTLLLGGAALACMIAGRRLR